MNFNQMGKYLYGLIIQKYHLEDSRIGNIPDYLAKHGLLNDDTIHFLKNVIKKSPEEIRNLIIEYLANLYIHLQLSKEDPIKVYLEETDLPSIIELFNEEPMVQEVLLNNFFISIYTNEWNLEKTIEDPNPNNNQEEIIETLPDKLRECIIYIVTSLMGNNLSMDETINTILITLYSNPTPTSSDEDFNNAIIFIEKYKEYLVKIIFADALLYTYANQDDEECKIILDYIVKCSSDDNIKLPSDAKITRKIIECFIMITSSIENRRALKESANEEIKSIYNKINFLSAFEDINPARN